jgi:hypothetical protein
VNHRVTSSRGIESSATAGTATPQVAGHRINPLEGSRDSAAARAQTVWGRHESPSPNPRTRWRSRRLHISQADYPCRKRQSRLRTAAINGPRPTGSPPRMTMTARPLHRVVLGQRRPGVWPAPRDGLILPALGGCRPQALARYTDPESSGDVQPWNRVECDSGIIHASSGWISHQSPCSFEGFGGRTSPDRLGRSSNTFNHSEDTLETA